MKFLFKLNYAVGTDLLILLFSTVDFCLICLYVGFENTFMLKDTMFRVIVENWRSGVSDGVVGVCPVLDRIRAE